MSAPTFSKFSRPDEPRPGMVTERDLDIIEAILRYRFSPTSELVRLVGGNEDVTQRRLRGLWERGLVNRFSFPGLGTGFVYYLDSLDALRLLSQGRGLSLAPQMIEEVRNHREKGYAEASRRGQYMQLGFLQHELMISRLHFVLELASRNSNGKVELTSWHQGAELSQKIEVPKVRFNREGNGYEGANELESLPHRPDAFFSLRLGHHEAHFFYEADRGTMNAADMKRKLRAHFHFVKRQQKHRAAYGVHAIRAVLIETTDEGRARKLMDAALDPMVTGQRRTGLFWFTITPLFTEPRQLGNHQSRPVPRYLVEPEVILGRIWALPDRSLLALSDAENSPSRPADVHLTLPRQPLQ